VPAVWGVGAVRVRVMGCVGGGVMGERGLGVLETEGESKRKGWFCIHCTKGGIALVWVAMGGAAMLGMHTMCSSTVDSEHARAVRVDSERFGFLGF
jgi:hypothetical protein